MFRRLITLAVSAATLCGCGTDSATESSVRAVLKVPDESLHLIDIPESVTDVSDMVVDRERNIWILNTTDPFFVKLNIEGQVLTEWGRRGGGPDEFRAPTGLAVDEMDNEVWTFDRGRLGFYLVSAGPDAIREVVVARDSLPWTPLSFDDLGIGGTRPWLAHTGEAFLIAGSALDGTPAPQPLAHYNANLYGIDERTGAVSVALSIRNAVGDPGAAGIPARILMPNPLWSICPDGSIALYDPIRQEARRYNSSGAVVFRVTIPAGPPVEVTLERIFGAIWRQARDNKRPEFRQDSAEMYRQFVKESAEIQDQLATHFPEFIGLQCTGDTLWLQRLSLTSGRMGRGPSWLMVRANGHLSEVELPSHFRPFRFSGDRVWGTVRDEWDVPSIAWLNLPS